MWRVRHVASRGQVRRRRGWELTMQSLATGSASGLALVACGLFYALLCVFSIVTGAIYVLGKRELNPLELPDRFVERLGDEGRLQQFARKMGFVTIVVGIVQGATAWAILAGCGIPAYALALGFTLFSLASVLFKLRGKVSAFPLLKLVAYLAILAVLIMGGTRARFLASDQAHSSAAGVVATETATPDPADPSNAA